ncbi:hypothetical protein [Sulfurimonas sp. NW9]|uniref:hypothetical protein n=1 Tax=Sulfurimonas sp. NW9 TaxID=2922728 RepID=UPI003DA89AAD
MELSTSIEIVGVVILLLTHYGIIVAKFQKHDNKIESLEKRHLELLNTQNKHSEYSKTLHNIEGKLEILLSLYQKRVQ